MFDYFNLPAIKNKLHVLTSITWNDCAQINYYISPEGSIPDYQYLLSRKLYEILIYSGDTDGVVPITDTLANLATLNLPIITPWTSYLVGGQNGGFYQIYNGLSLVTVRGAGHMVPQWRRQAAFYMFSQFLNGGPFS